MRRCEGLTLLEVLVSAAILSVVAGGIYQVLIQGTRSVGQSSGHLDAVTDFNRVVETLRRDARSLFWREGHPILVEGVTPDRSLSFSVVEGVTAEGLAVVVPVEWRFTGSPDGGALERVYSPGLPGERTHRFFAGELRYFDVLKLDEDGVPMGGGDGTPPAALECWMEHSRGERLQLRVFLYSRYQRDRGADPLQASWFANHHLRPVPASFPVITAAGAGSTAVTVEGGRLVGGAIVTSGDAMGQRL